MKDCCCWLRIATTAAASRAFRGAAVARGLLRENNVTNTKHLTGESPLGLKHITDAEGGQPQLDSNQVKNSQSVHTVTSL